MEDAFAEHNDGIDCCLVRAKEVFFSPFLPSKHGHRDSRMEPRAAALCQWEGSHVVARLVARGGMPGSHPEDRTLNTPLFKDTLTHNGLIVPERIRTGMESASLVFSVSCYSNYSLWMQIYQQIIKNP